jgi:hypothetical protein
MQLVLWNRLEAPVGLLAFTEEGEAKRHVNQRMIIHRACLDQADTNRFVLTKTTCEHATGRARADDDVIKTFHKCR